MDEQTADLASNPRCCSSHRISSPEQRGRDGCARISPCRERTNRWVRPDRLIPEAEAEGELAALYGKLRSAKTGSVDRILASHSLHPETMRNHDRLYRTLMPGKGDLTY